jgi:hypothetical protein
MGTEVNFSAEGIRELCGGAFTLHAQEMILSKMVTQK